MDKIEKLLAELNKAERASLKSILSLIKMGKFDDLDVKKLKGKIDIFRVRKGKFRIIYHVIKNSISIISLEKRSDHTYNLK